MHFARILDCDCERRLLGGQWAFRKGPKNHVKEEDLKVKIRAPTMSRNPAFRILVFRTSKYQDMENKEWQKFNSLIQSIRMGCGKFLTSFWSSRKNSFEIFTRTGSKSCLNEAELKACAHVIFSCQSLINN